MPKILHTARYAGTPWEILKSVVPEGFTVETLEELSDQCLLRQAVDADYLLVSGRLPIDEGVLTAAKHLKMIQRTGVGTEMLDIEAIKKHNISVYVNAGVNARSVAEHTIALMLACLKRLPQINGDTHKGAWKKQQQGLTTHELYGKTVALVGMGNIGRTVAAMLQPFGVTILYTDVFRQSSEVENKLGLTYCESFEGMLPKADILSFHCPLTPENTEILNIKTMKLLKTGSIVVNTARGKLINPEDLYESLKSGRISSVALDTHYEEPLKDGYKLAELDNVILTPHIGGLSYEAFKSMMVGAMENIKAFEEGRLEEIATKRLV
ncbi:D-3-phosphoglycerate dehydrogenase [Prevotella sp. khp7]|uniref:2-hydroxyacid dehydrogenase n=1 Tax=Prevotella sp. khp7 TaxID=1761885 RepID=UPI0008ACAEB7|nr:2-hydroxyacid dehydrogenase [Prevotella sp. khp7]SEW24149.1 D-3-phosphoglycerate dehydrogenase [Prevotella sp. khp7]